MKTKENILFDLDGTLTDPMLGITKSVHYALRSFGIDEDSLEKLTPFIGPPLKGSFQKFYGFDEEKAEEALAKYREYFSVTGMFENKVYDGIPALLEGLKYRGKKVILATSKPEIYARQILEHFDLLRYFDFIGGSLLDGRRVEKSDVIQYVLEENRIQPENAVMIGDRCFDILGGQSQGLITVGVLYGYGDRKELEEAGADYITETVSELSDLFF
ncbi:MAG: HAD family hydrolase [Ruminococcaceae bacterium]|nr:HAD family hydrolase [Oscillospiraceae bacterium]